MSRCRIAIVRLMVIWLFRKPQRNARPHLTLGIGDSTPSDTIGVNQKHLVTVVVQRHGRFGHRHDQRLPRIYFASKRELIACPVDQLPALQIYQLIRRIRDSNLFVSGIRTLGIGQQRNDPNAVCHDLDSADRHVGLCPLGGSPVPRSDGLPIAPQSSFIPLGVSFEFAKALVV